MPNCLKGCINNYNRRGLRLPIDRELLMPWVEVWISGGKKKIGVSNFSSRINKAVIKSFQFGMSNGQGVLIEIVDEEGGNFTNFFEKITTGNVESATSKYILEFQFGWAVAGCKGFEQTFGEQACCPISTLGDIKTGLRSCIHKMVVRNITCNVSHGAFKFSIEASDLTMDMVNTRSRETFGTDKDPMRMVPAILQMFKKKGVEVTFLSLNAACQSVPFEFSKQGDIDEFQGAMGKWAGMNRNLVQAARDWLNSYVSKRGKGIITYWDTTDDGKPLLVFMETNQLTCESTRDMAPYNVGTYIVNGGKCLSCASEVLTEDGWLRIGYLVKQQYSGMVCCVDNGGFLHWRKVTGHHRSKIADRKSYKVHLHNSRQRGGSVSGAILTDDHLVLTNKGYVKVDELNPNEDKIHSGTMMPSDNVHQAIIGTMLGDSHIRRNSYAFDCSHCYEQEVYLKHKANILGIAKLKNKKKNIKVTGKASPYWRMMRKLFYKNGVKKITKECLKDFTVVSLAYLYMDDGNLDMRSGGRRPRSSIATCSFSGKENDLLIKAIKKIGIDCYKRKDGKYWRLFFDCDNTEKLSKSIAPYVLKLFDYKLMPCDRIIEKSIVDFGENPYYDTFDVMLWPIKEKTVYCLSVEEYNNFITHSGVVHNCSPVISFTPSIQYVMDQFFQNTSGVAGGTLAPVMRVEEGPEPCLRNMPNSKDQGMRSTQTESDNDYRIFGTQATLLAGQNKLSNSKANLLSSPFTADMRIQGDPTYDKPVLCQGHYVSVVYINPFRIARQGDVCDWLAASGCQKQLSNSNWMIWKLFHEIKEGSFTTTLKLRLAAPGLDIDRRAPIGGMPSGETMP